MPALPEAVLTYLFETKLAAVSFSGCAARPEVAVLFGLLFVHVNCRTKVCSCVCVFKAGGKAVRRGVTRVGCVRLAMFTLAEEPATDANFSRQADMDNSCVLLALL